MFDTALIESAHPVRDGRRAKSLPLAIGLHASVLGAVILAAAWSTGDAPEPPLPIIFPVFVDETPPLKGDGGAGHPAHTVNRSTKAVPHEPVPVRVPDETQVAPQDSPAHDLARTDVAGGD